MRKLITVTIAAFCMAVIVSPVMAQSSTPEERAKQQSEWMKTKLQLNDDQYQQVSAINLKYAQQMDGVLKGGGGKMAKMKQARPIQQAKDAELKKVFTEEQGKQYDELKKELRGEMKARRGGS